MQKIVNFLDFIDAIKIPKILEFKVRDFYKPNNRIVPMHFESQFFGWILNPTKEMSVSVLKETALNRFCLQNDLYDTEIQNHFETKPVIPVKIFLAQLKYMLENTVALDTRSNINVFNVDLSEIGDNRVVSVWIWRNFDGWCINAIEFDSLEPWAKGRLFFAPDIVGIS